MKLVKIIALTLVAYIMTIYASPAKKTMMPPVTFKFTKVYCDVTDHTYVRINLCQCRPIRRGVTAFNFNVTHLQRIYALSLNYVVKKKEGWYKPFLFNYTINICEYVQKRNNPVLNMLRDYITSFADLKLSCPYEKGDVVIKNMTMKEDLLKQLPAPNGEYELSLIWHMNGHLTYTVKIYVELYKFDN